MFLTGRVDGVSARETRFVFNFARGGPAGAAAGSRAAPIAYGYDDAVPIRNLGRAFLRLKSRGGVGVLGTDGHWGLGARPIMNPPFAF